MEIITNIIDSGVKEKIDFNGATLSNGLSIEDTLNENKKLKQDVVDLKNDLEKFSSILPKLIPNKKMRYIVEIILLLLSIKGLFF